LAAAIERGQKAGDIASDESPRALARFLANAMSGINVLARADPGKAALSDVVRVTLDALDAPSRRRRKSS
jgi:TetR/AcrR family transcriptional repressor of nem operon